MESTQTSRTRFYSDIARVQAVIPVSLTKSENAFVACGVLYRNKSQSKFLFSVYYRCSLNQLTIWLQAPVSTFTAGIKLIALDRLIYCPQLDALLRLPPNRCFFTAGLQVDYLPC